MPQNYKFGGGANESVLHPLVLAALILAIILVFILKRKYVVAPLVFMAFLVPEGQQLYVGGVHLFVLRILILVIYIRAVTVGISPGEARFAGGWNGIDTAFTVCTVTQTAASLLLFQDSGALIYQIGFLWDYLLGYFTLRILIRNTEDCYFIVKCLALVTVPLALGMILEQRLMMNVFGILGGVQAYPDVREGKIRSQGAFEHSLTAGAFAATIIPVLFWLCRNAKSRAVGIIGMLGASIMVWTTNSSTSILSGASSVFALCCWPIRKAMKKVRWAIVITLFGLNLVMKAPVWMLISRIDVTGSSSSYHRAQLVDQFINHFWDWWLIGVKDTSTWGLDMWDAQNQFVNIGEGGGLLALIYFILEISRSFGMLGNTRRAVQGQAAKEWTVWCMGSAMFASVVGFFGVNYFDQSKMWWFILLAMISAVGSAPLQKNARSQPKLVQQPVEVV